MDIYFDQLEKKCSEIIQIAKYARKNGLDPVTHPEIPVAKDLADRVEKLLGIEGIAERIRELEREMPREEVALRIGLDFAEGRFTRASRVKLVENAVRTAVAILTEGVVAAPIEGIARVEGSEYIKIYYAGPIRSAGGTAQALSVLVADYVRRKLGFSAYKPRKEEIERYVAEIHLYRRIANLQYTPMDREIRLIVENCPICIDGEPTEDVEVEGFKNLERVSTNRVRGGMALVIAEGIALKAPKIKKYVDQIGIDGWEWINGLIKHEDSEGEKLREEKFLDDLIAGRPVFSHPSRSGGFRLRYGRSRNTGLAAAGINPATMVILDEFLSSGTQMKTELPGKAAAIVSVDSIEGPTVRLKNGDVLRIDKIEDAYELKDQISEIIDVGEILISYGDFLENNCSLPPSPYCIEWWKKEVPFVEEKPDPERAFQISEEYGVPLHPDYTYLWHDISVEELETLASRVSMGKMENGVLSIPLEEETKRILEKLLVHHRVRSGRIWIENPYPLIRCLGLGKNLKKTWDHPPSDSVIECVSTFSGVKIRARSPTRIGGRMGRPEKSKRREMKPAPHVLFPLGEYGGKNRLFKDAMGTIEVEIGVRRCKNCGRESFLNRCECGGHTVPRSIKSLRIDLRSLYSDALEFLGEKNSSDLKGVKGLNSKFKTPEPIEKGILRNKYDVFVFKDGTIRYDLTDLPLTHFKPKEIGTDIDKLRELGYEVNDPEELLELKPQDVILSEDAGEYLLRVSKFIDDLLSKYYKIDKYYNAERKEDLIGELVIGLAPHTSAGVLGRIIGFTRVSACFAHPFFHAAKRRNCDGDEDTVMLLMDGMLNFSRSYLPDKRGGEMDAPLVLTTRIDPKEIDKEAQNIDVMDSYPIEFYEATERFSSPKEIENIMKTVGTEFCEMKFTHPTSDISKGPEKSAYKTLNTMAEKVEAQLNLAKKIRAVDEMDVAERVLNHHFIPDLKGNLRAFATQKVRCVKCNAKYRRPPLRGVCTARRNGRICGGKLILTVHEASVKKYLDVSLRIAEEYGVSTYISQRLRLIEKEVRSLFESDTKKQMGLEDFMGI
ncbi:MAG: DNA polymerase II large subunit [Candidatus Syntropharchaeia archaeon]